MANIPSAAKELKSSSEGNVQGRKVKRACKRGLWLEQSFKLKRIQSLKNYVTIYTTQRGRMTCSPDGLRRTVSWIALPWGAKMMQMFSQYDELLRMFRIKLLLFVHWVIPTSCAMLKAYVVSMSKLVLRAQK